VTLPTGSFPVSAAELGDTLYVLNSNAGLGGNGDVFACAIGSGGTLTCAQAAALSGTVPSGIGIF
jgi:hypothetical protein